MIWINSLMLSKDRPFLCKDYLSFKASCHKDISPNFLQYRKLIDKIALYKHRLTSFKIEILPD